MKKFLSGFCLLSVSLFGYSQEELSPTISVIPPSPEVMAMNKHTEIPVSYYTGLPQISVPIFNIEMNNIQIPISLDYHASGLRVSEYASSVGAGWSLSGGGVIARTIQGRADERTEQTYQGYFYASNWLNSDGTVKNSILSDCSQSSIFSSDPPPSVIEYATPVNPPDYLALGWWDSQPDQYTFSLPGGPSGSFIFNHLRELILLSPSDIEVQHPFQTPVSYSTYLNDYEWEIKDSNGTIYTFENFVERTTSSSACTDVTNISFHNVPMVDHEFEENQTSWFLTKIENGYESVTFEYEADYTLEDYALSSTYKYAVEGADDSYETQCVNNIARDTYRLIGISSSNGYEVEITYTGSRSDLTGAERMDEIRILFQDELAKTFKLDNNHYFGNNDKLKLEKVQVLDKQQTEINAYEFEYYEHQYGGFPVHNSVQQDYWGLYNGATGNNVSILAEWWDDDYHFNENSTTSRDPDIEFAKVGSLKKVVYPTGGAAEFDYELHDYSGPNTWKQISKSVFADGEVNMTDYDSIEFTVNQDCSVSFFQHQYPEDGLDAGYYWKQWDDLNNTWVNYTPSTRQGQIPGVTIAQRKNLDSGRYLLWAESWGSPIEIELKFEEKGNVNFQRVGGLRVKKITHSDPLSGLQTHSVFDYTKENEFKSSGLMLTSPINDGFYTKFANAIYDSLETYCTPDVPTFYLNLASYVQLPLATVKGSHVGYSRVEVHKTTSETLDGYTDVPSVNYVPEYAFFKYDNTSQGYEVFEYINEYPDGGYNTNYPYVPPPRMDYANGSLKKRQVYKMDSIFSQQFNKWIQSPVLSRETINYYDTIYTDTLTSYIFRRYYTSLCYECSVGLNIMDNSYTQYGRKVRLRKTEDKTFENGKEMVSVSLFDYNFPSDHELASKSLIVNIGDTLKTSFTRDILNPQLVTGITRYRNDILISGEQLNYSNNLPSEYLVLNRDSSLYELRKRISWDSDALAFRVEEWSQGIISNHAISKRSIYLYNQSQVVASIENISLSEVSNKLSQINASYTTEWLKEETNLVLVKNVLNSLRGSLEENQYMTTYLYQDGSQADGPVEIIDPNGRSQKFEYDSFGRLHKVLDHEDNILKKIDYIYKNNN